MSPIIHMWPYDVKLEMTLLDTVTRLNQYQTDSKSTDYYWPLEALQILVNEVKSFFRPGVGFVGETGVFFKDDHLMLHTLMLMFIV